MSVDAPMSARAPGAEFDRLSGSVAQDLDEIFREAAPRTRPADATPRARAITSAAPLASRAGRASLATLGAMAAAGLAGLSIGSILTRPPPPPIPPPAQTAPAPAPVLPGPVQVPPTPLVVAQALKSVEAPAKPKAAKPARVRPATGCARLSGTARARCAYPAVLAADKRLRQAYARATRAGVSRSTLISYRNRWASLRRRANDEPQRVIAGYGAMAAELSRLARKERRG